MDSFFLLVKLPLATVRLGRALSRGSVALDKGPIFIEGEFLSAAEPASVAAIEVVLSN
jgi:hypothetical protein